MREITLREVCKMVGVTRRAVQGYEKEGLVAASGKNKYGYLLYDENAVGKIRMIKQYQDFGFSLKEIKNLLQLSEEDFLQVMNNKLIEMKENRDNLEKNIKMMEIIILGKQQ